MYEKRLKRDEIESLALKTLRQNKDRKLLNNTNVDCFIDGYCLAQENILKSVAAKELLQGFISDLKYRYQSIEDNAGYGGRCLTDDEEKEREFIIKCLRAVKPQMENEK